MLATILSRCQRFDLRRISSPLIVKHLAHIAKLEAVQIDEPALFAIARGADGGMRDAESTLDQLISFCGNKIEEPDVLSMFGLAAQNQILSLSQALLEGQVQSALVQLSDFAQGGKDLGRLLGDLLNHFRNLLIFQVSKGDLGMIEVSEAAAVALKAQAALSTVESLTRILEVLTDSEIRLRDATSKKVMLEVTLLKIIEARNASSLDAVLKQLVQLRGEAGLTTATAASTPVARPTPAPTPQIAPRAAVPTPAAPPAPVQQLAETPPAAPIDEPAPVVAASGSLDDLWKALLESVGRASPFTRSYLVEAQPVSFERGTLVIGFDPQFSDYLGLVDNPRNHALLQTKLAELGHPNSHLKFIKQDRDISKAPVVAPAAPVPAKTAPAAPTPSPFKTSTPAPAPKAEKAASAAFNKDEFKNDPLIKKALEVFKGQIIEVRA